MREERDVHYWLEQFGDPVDDNRWLAVDRLRDRLTCEELIPLFVSLLETDPYWRVRALACHELYDISHDEERGMLVPFVSRIGAAVFDPCVDVGLEAIRVLEMVGTEASAGLPALREAVLNPDQEIRAAALDAIEVIEGRRPRIRCSSVSPD